MTTEPKPGGVAHLAQRIGGLRCALLACVAAIIAIAPLADGTTHMHDWRLLPSVIAPSLMMMLVFALPLDMTMARIFMADADADERARLRFVIRLELLAYVLMLAAWSPFMLKVLDFSPLS